MRKSLFLSLFIALLALSPAFAQLKDAGPVSTVNGFPQYYRDLNNVPLELCLSAAQSPNLLNGGPMCITDAAPVVGGGGGQGLFNPLLPVVFPSNFPTNPIYFDATAQMPDQTQQLNPFFLYNAQYTATLMGGFGPGGAGITPTAGTQTTFAFITIQADAPVAGAYTVTHPYGSQTFNVTLPGPNAIVFSQLVPVPPAVGNFTGALASSIGPFLKWTPTLPPAIGTEQFIGDPTTPHAVTGSPTGNNFFRVAGPTGSNLDGAGGTTVTTTLFNISGKLAAVPLAVSSLTPAPASPQSAGASVTFTAAAAGGVGPLEYQFTRTLGASSTVVQAYSANPVFTWNTTGAAAGAYAVKVDVRQVGTTTPVATQSVNYTINGGAPLPITVSSLTANPASPQTAGTSVTFTAAASGGTGALEYQFTRTLGANSTVVQAYSTNPAWTWNTTGATAGSYTVQVDVRQTGTTASAANQSLTYTVNAVTPPPVTISSLTASPASPQTAGVSVTFTAAASGGTGALEYQFTRTIGANSTVVQAYSTNPAWTWNTTGATAGSYTVQVDVRQTGTTASAANRTLTYVINAGTPPAVTLSSFTANPASPQAAGASVTFTAAATGGTGSFEYRFMFGATVVQAYSTNPSWTWNTTGFAASSYTIQVDVRQTGTTASAANQTLTYVISPQLPAVTISSLTANPASPQTAGTSVTFTAAATGGSGSLEYRYTVGATVARPYATTPSWTWNTAGLAAGAYSIKVDVRSVGSAADSAASQTLSYTIGTQQASGQLRDAGPASTVNGFPQWYRDNNNVALELCLSPALSPNLLNPGPMCILDAGIGAGNFNQALPVVFPTNFPSNPIYFDASAQLQNALGTFQAQFTASLEGGFGAGGIGFPAAGTQTAFVTTTIQMDAPVIGTYTVTHPYGTQTFNVTIPGQPINFQAYVPVTAAVGNFTGALAGPIGPFLQWTPTLPPAIGTEQFIGDPNIPHAVTGSPTGNNFFRVVGPAGSNLDGLGGTTITTNLFNISGKLATTVPVTVSSLTANPASPQTAGTSVTFTAAATGGTGSLEYRFTLGATVVQAYSTNPSWTWNTTGLAAGAYNVKVDVRQVGSAIDSAANQSLSYTVNAVTPPAVTISSLTANPASPQTAGTSVTFTAAATGGTGSLEYRFTLGATVVQAYSTNASWTWNTTGAAAGIYSVKVDVRSVGSAVDSAANQSLSYTVNAATPPAVTISSLTANPASPQTVGASVTFTAAATGGTGALEYQFTRTIGATTDVVQAYSTNPAWTWNTTGATIGTYTIQIDVREAGTTASAANQSLTYVVNAPPLPVAITSFTAAPASPQIAGAPVTFTAAATGGSGALEYQFTRTVGMTPTVVQAYSTNPAWTWDTTGTTAGSYTIQVDVRQAGTTASAATQSSAFVITTSQPGSGPTLTTDPLILEPVLDPVAQPKFVNQLVDLLDPSYIFTPENGPDPNYDYFRVSMRELSHTMGLRDDTQASFPLLPPTRIWAYGDARETIDSNGQPTGTGAPSGFHSFPGPTFLRKSTLGPAPDKPIKVVWSNEIPGGPNYHLMGIPHPNLTAVDTTMMCGMNAPYCRPFQRLIPHVHGGHTWDYSDGIPEQWFSPGFSVIGTQFWTPPQEEIGTFTYTLNQTMANLWYHDHATGITRLNVQTGLAGEFLLRDDTELGLITSGVIPAYPYEVPLVIQDKTFAWVPDPQDATRNIPAIAVPDIPLSDPKKTDPATGQPCVQGSLSPACWVIDPVEKKPIPSITPEFFGNMIVVNGKTWPFKSVEPRKYRLRLLPATDSRSFFFQLQNRSANPPALIPFLVIGTEQGLLPSPVMTNTLIMQPAERLDVVVDFTNLQGAQVVLTNLGPEGPFSPTTLPVNPATVQPQPPSPANTTGQIMMFRVDAPLNTAIPNATVDANTTLTGPIPTLPPSITERNLVMKETSDQYGRLILKINGLGYLDPTTEIPALDTTETWAFVNLTPDVHPMHIHLIKFQIVSREDLSQPAVQTVPPTWTPLGTFEPIRPEEMGWKDTIQAYPNQITRVKATFDVPGIYIFHCHILSHEDYDKMRHYAVVMTPAGADLQIFSGPTAQPAASAQPVVFHARGLTGLSYPLPPQSHGFEFQFSVKHPVLGWVVKQPFSDASNFIWSPRGTFPGTYTVRVDLRIPTTTAIVASAEIQYLLYGEPPKAMAISPADASLPAGLTTAKATFTANAAPAGKYEYRFRLLDPSQNSTTVQDFSTNPSWTWTPAASAGVYTVAVDARALGSTGNGDITATTTFTIVAKSPTMVTIARTGSSQVASGSPTPVTFTANPAPAGQYEYRYSVKDPVSGWNIGSYGADNTFTWTPPANQPGLYVIQVEVRPAGTTAKPTVAAVGYVVKP